MAYQIDDALSQNNIADVLDDAVVEKLGSELCQVVASDEDSRSEWMDSQDEWLKLASQVRSTKSFPWQGAANIKYPLMTIACLQFHARALPSLINSAEPVMAKVIGKDPTGEKQLRASRVRKYMSYQVMEEMEEWLDEMDRMLFVLPMIGICYKKTYHSEVMNRLRSVLILPKDLIVNYQAQSYERARLTHVLYMDENEIVELQREGLFSDIELNDPEYKVHNQTRDEILGFTHPDEGVGDSDELHRVYEIHGWWDLDEDGYKEPYIITVHADSEQVLRIVARWDNNGVKTNDKGEIIKITALDFFTPYTFLPDPNSAVYGLGFGTLLGPTNEAVNTLINQLIDAGTLSNLQSGFLGRGMKIKGGVTRFRPGEWKIVNQSGADLKASVFPMPVREPSGTLFNLLGLLIQSGERISSVSEMMVGETPGQNTPATTSMAALEQGLKVFTGIYKRIFRQLKAEYKKIYYLNSLYLDEEKYSTVLDEAIGQELESIEGQASEEEMLAVQEQLEAENASGGAHDFDLSGIDILPAADPNMVTEAQKMIKSQALLEKLGMGLPVNPQVVTRRALEAEQHEDIDELMNIPQQGPSVEEREFELKTIQEHRATIDSYFDNLKKVAEAEGIEIGTQVDQYRAVVEDTMKTIELERGANGNTQGQQATQGVPPGQA